MAASVYADIISSTLHFWHSEQHKHLSKNNIQLVYTLVITNDRAQKSIP